MRKIFNLAGVLVLILCLTGCRGYTDASVKIPAGWTTYTAGPVSFQFEAGWTETDSTELAEGLAGGASIFSEQATAAVVKAWQSKIREQGTVDYLVLTSYTMEEETSAEDLEAIMDDLNGMARTIKNQAGLVTEIEQNARIRRYGHVDALTVSVHLTGEEVECMIQLGLVPEGKYVFQIAYCDFTQIKDDTTLEAILSSFTAEEIN